MSWSLRVALFASTSAASGCGPTCEPAPEGTLGDPTSWEQAFLSEGSWPEPPLYGQLEAEDGLALSYADWVPSAWSGDGPIVVLVHGSTAYGDLYAVLGEAMATRGALARLVDLRGHGRSVCGSPEVCGASSADGPIADDGRTWPGRPGDSLDADQLVRDLHAHVEDLRRRWPGAPITLAGHSSGGGLVSRYVEHVGTSGLRSVALLAPFNHPEQPQNDLQSWECGRVVGTPYAQVDVGALGDARRGNPHRYVLDFHKNEAYVTPLDTLRYTYTMMQGLSVSDPDGFHRALSVPTLWVAGERDALLALEASRREFEKLAGGGAFVVVLDTSHVGVSWSPRVGELLADFASEPSSQGSGELVAE